MMDTSISGLIAAALPDALVLSEGSVNGYEIGARLPAAVVRVTGAEQIATVLNLASERRWAVAARAGGTMLDLGNPIARLEVVLDLAGLDGVVDYQPDDLTLTVQAGIPVAAIGRLLEGHGQSLPLDVPLPERATIGGALATNAHGPRRLRAGTARDLVIGMQAAVPMVGLARSGGKVVKNVAGYDLAKLHIGGLGTTGIITEVTFKLSPSPASRGALVAAFATGEAAHITAMQITSGQLFPAAVEVLGPAVAERLLLPSSMEVERDQWVLAVLLLGVEEAVERQRREIAALCTEAGSPAVTTLDSTARERLFARIRDFGRSLDDPAILILRALVMPTETAQAVQLLADRTSALGTQPEFITRPGSGTVIAHWRAAPTEAVAEAVRWTREGLYEMRGGLVVERAPEAAKCAFDVWGLEGPDLALMRRLKETYDPQNVLNPGRYVAHL